MNKQIRLLGYFLVFLFVLLFVQVNNIQVLQAEKLDNHPGNNRNAVRDFASERGFIQTADGVPIATSEPSGDRYNFARKYPEGPLYAHITGFFSFTYGNEGLEKVYNDDLAGKTFSLRNIDDLLRDRVTTNNVTITVTDSLQEVARSALGDRRGAVVALDPKTGAVLAMYSNPTFDPNSLATHDFPAATQAREGLLKDKNNPMLPRAYRESYPPGSTFKVVTSSAAYESRPELVDKDYPIERSFTPRGTRLALSNFGGESCGGSLTNILRISCNSAFARMGVDLGGPAMTKQAEAFGFNKIPPLDEPAVARSRYPQPSEFVNNQPFLAYSAIGQGNVSATPLQMAMVAAGIANNGVVMKPHLLKEMRNNSGDVVRSGSADPWQRATSSSTARSMTANMVEVAKRGTATAAQIPGVQVAAKTGTAQTSGNLVNTWLISFAPADDPKVAVAVIVENQPGVSEATGGRVAAPIAQRVMKSALGAP